MNKIALNETPIRTVKSFHINNIELDNINIPEIINHEFENVVYINESSKDIITEDINLKDDVKPTYGLGEELNILTKNNINKVIKLDINSKTPKQLYLKFLFYYIS